MMWLMDGATTSLCSTRPRRRDQAVARQILTSLEVSGGVLDAAEAANPGLDWFTVVYALDGVFLSHGGGMGQYGFLHKPSPELEGRTPVEALSQPGGPEAVCGAAHAFSEAHRQEQERRIRDSGPGALWV
jgi:hypothetical protein